MSLGHAILPSLSKTDLLHSCPICSAMKSGALKEIADISTGRAVKKGEMLTREGDLCTGFFLVAEGRIRIFKSSAQGKEKVLYIAEQGMTFGETALFGPGLFIENAMALTPSKILHIPRAEFLNLLRHNPDLSFQVMESLCGSIRRLSSSVENIAFLGAKDKVVQFLLGLTKKSSSTGEAHIKLPAKKKEIADRLGITPETLSRVLKDLKQRKVLETHKDNSLTIELHLLKEEAPE